ncbi:hypothetical protein K438DRAFT_825529 [Mycena galopus ATCC 62051]|nr:hypothetical protein K438DRAFT_825529 [Mycena galopus ATCC 62051]
MVHSARKRRAHALYTRTLAPTPHPAPTSTAAAAAGTPAIRWVIRAAAPSNSHVNIACTCHANTSLSAPTHIRPIADPDVATTSTAVVDCAVSSLSPASCPPADGTLPSSMDSASATARGMSRLQGSASLALSSDSTHNRVA